MERGERYSEGPLLGRGFGGGERLGEHWPQAQLATERGVDLEPKKKAEPGCRMLGKNQPALGIEPYPRGPSDSAVYSQVPTGFFTL